MKKQKLTLNEEISQMKKMMGKLMNEMEDTTFEEYPSYKDMNEKLTDEDKAWLYDFDHSIDHISSNDEEREMLFNYYDKHEPSWFIINYKNRLNLSPNVAAQDFASIAIDHKPSPPNIPLEDYLDLDIPKTSVDWKDKRFKK